MVPETADLVLEAPDPVVLRERLQRAASSVTPDWLRDQRDDLVQMALEKLLKSNRMEPGVPMQSAFLYRVMHSVVVDEIRRQKRRNETGMTPDDREPVSSAPAADPERSANAQEVGIAIVECLNALKGNRRRAVTLYLQGHTVPETARLLRFEHKKAENLVYRGLKQLREALRERGLEP